MGRSKDLFMEMMERMLSNFNWFEDQTFGALDDLETETFETVKGKYKTVITCYFTKEGRLARQKSTTELIASENERTLEQLEYQKNEAIRADNFELAAKIRDQIKELELKPTEKTN